MADETVDFNAGSNDWYTYDDVVGCETVNVNGSSVIFQEVTDTMVKQDTQNDDVQYDVEDGGGDGWYVIPHETDNDFSKHNLILKEIINEDGKLAENYFCQECFVEYSDVNEFLRHHPGIELLNENPEEESMADEEEVATVEDHVIFEEEAVVDDVSRDKLWDLVENIREEEHEEDHGLTDLAKSIENETQNIVPKTEALDAESERYYCYECQQVFTDLQSAEEHDCTQSLMVEEAQGQLEEMTDFACEYCRQVYSTYDELLTHIQNCEQNDTVPLSTKPAAGSTFHCELCNRDYPSVRSYNNHQRLHNKVKKASVPTGPTKCEICNTTFESSKNLKLHMKMHNERSVKSIQDALPAGAQSEYSQLNQFYCEICNKSFDQKLLTIHKNMHQNVEEYNCSKCNKQFENSVSYEMHLQMHSETQGNSSKQTIAPDLDLFGNAAIASNGSRKKHACQYCGKEFQRPYEKVKHERIHTGEKPYNCEVCGKSFRVSYSLTLHLRTHTDIRPYVCATCNKRFKQQSVYVHHLKTHIAERQYKCDVCGKSFRTSVQMCGHRNSHNKPFNCTECNRPFASMYAVKIHMKSHNKTHKANKNLTNRCELCGASYARLFALRYHLREQHGVEVDPGQLLDAEHSNSLNSKDMDVETAILMNAANEAQLGDEHNGEIGFMDEDNDGNSDNGDLMENDVGVGGHRDNINQAMNHDDDLEETVAATQTILQNEEIIVDHFHPEEIITDWLK